MRLGLIAAAEDVLKFGCRSEGGSNIRFFKDASELRAYFWYEWDANI